MWRRTRASAGPAAFPASRKRSPCLPRRPLDPVARAADCQNELRLEPIIDLATQPADQDLQYVRERIMIVVPDVRRNRPAIDDLARMPQQELQQCKLL